MAFLNGNDKNRSNVKNGPVFDTQHDLRKLCIHSLQPFYCFLTIFRAQRQTQMFSTPAAYCCFCCTYMHIVPWYKSMILVFLISVVKYIILYFLFRRDTKYRRLLKTEICLPSLWKNPVKVNCRCEDKLKNKRKKHKLNWDTLGTTASDKYWETVLW